MTSRTGKIGEIRLAVAMLATVTRVGIDHHNSGEPPLQSTQVVLLAPSLLFVRPAGHLIEGVRDEVICTAARVLLEGDHSGATEDAEMLGHR